MKFKQLDKYFISEMHDWGVPFLRVSLGVVFFWFGALKVIGASPVADLIHATYSFLPAQQFLFVLGVWEMAIGLGLIFKIALRFTLFLLWLQMAGTFLALVLNPAIFFQNGNPLLLTIDGEFVVKNLVLIASSLVIGGYSVKTSLPTKL